MTGQIVTFYSYKGGSGRSMAVANVAWILATNGKKVLVIDWDIEAPGLHRYFLPLMRSDPDLKRTEGLVDRLWAYVDQLLVPKEEGAGDPLDLADLSGFAQPLNLPPGAKGALHFVPAGRQDGEYGARSQGFDWAAFYERFGGAAFIARMREKLTAAYDFVLIDSRTGLSDTSGVCTVELPDTVVHCFVHNRQSVLGIAATAESIARQQPQGRAIRQYPVPMRVEKNVPDFEGNWQFARDRLDDLLSGLPTEEKEFYWAQAEILYRARYAGGETLAAIVDRPGERNTLLADMLWLAHRVTGVEGLEAIQVSEEQRETYQRAVALRDPREAELKSFARNPAASHPRLLEWLDELQREGVDSLSWVEKLTGGIQAASDDLAATEQAETALILLERAIETYRGFADKRIDRLAFSLSSLLLKYATICLRTERPDDAALAAQECADIRRLLNKENADLQKISLAEAIIILARANYVRNDGEGAERAARAVIALIDEPVLYKGRNASILIEASAILVHLMNRGIEIDGVFEILEKSVVIFERIAGSGFGIDLYAVFNMSSAVMEMAEDMHDFGAMSEIGNRVSGVLLKAAKKNSSSSLYVCYSTLCVMQSVALEKMEMENEAHKCVEGCLRDIRPSADGNPSLFKNAAKVLLERYSRLSQKIGKNIDKGLVKAFKRIVDPPKRIRKPANKRVSMQPESV